MFFVFSNLEAYSDPGGDTCEYYLSAKSFYEGRGPIVDFSYSFYSFENDSTKVYPITRQHWIPVLFPIYLSAFFLISPSIVLSSLATILLVLPILVLYFHLIKKIYSQNIAILSVVIISFNSSFVFVSRIPVTEPLYLTFTFLALLLLYRGNYELKNIILLAFVASLAFYTRHAGLVLLGSIGLFFLVNKRYKTFFIYSITSIILLIPFFLLNIYFSEDPFYFLKTTSLSLNALGKSQYSEIGMEYRIRVLYRYISGLTESNMLGIFSILGLLGWIVKKARGYLKFVVVYLVVFLFFHSFLTPNYVSRYAIPLVFLLIPVCISVLSEINDKFNFSREKRIFVLASPIVVYFIFNMNLISKQFEEIRNNYYDDSKNYSYFIKNSFSEANIASTSSFRTNYFTGRPSISIPANADKRGLNTFIKIYNINYFYVENTLSPNYSKNKFLISTLFRGDSFIDLEDYRLKLVRENRNKVSNDIDKNVSNIYSVTKKEKK